MEPKDYWDKIKRSRRLKIAAVLFAIALAVLVILASMRIQEVTVEGSTHYSEREFAGMLFPGDWDRNPFLFLYRENTGRSIDVPFVDRYSVEMEGLNKVHIIVYEKQIVGYLDYLGSYLYFDRDGIAVEHTTEEMEDVPRFIGLGGGEIVMNEKLPVENNAVFQVALSVSQFLQSNSIEWEGAERTLVSLVDTVHVDKYAHTTCILGDLQIYLGNGKNMEEKLLLMADVLPKLEGRSGTVYLDNYSEAEINPSYVFKEGQLRLTSADFAVQEWEEESPEETEVWAEPMDEPLEDATGEGFMEEVEIPEPEEKEDEAPASVDGDGVDDIPEDYVGGDGYK